MTRDQPSIGLTVDGVRVEVEDPSDTLLGLLRHQLGLTTVKDGCSPQGQCGCCTVLVDGQPRVACVTPVRRLADRSVTTLAGLDPDRRRRWAEAFSQTGGSQCGFCTPGIIVRFDALAAKLAEASAPDATPAVAPVPVMADSNREPVTQALLAHLCRCTGWQTILEAWDRFHEPPSTTTETAVRVSLPSPTSPRRLVAAARRAELEGGVAQQVGPDVALGQGGFAADEAPPEALIALSDGKGGWVVGETLAEVRVAAARTQGRRTTVQHSWPLEVPPGEWAATLRTTWVEPAYLETDASWCRPGGEPYSAVANGGAFGAKTASPVPAAARELADLHARAVLVLGSREDATRWGPKRPPVAGGANADGSGLLKVVATPGIAEAIAAVAPRLVVEQVAVPGPVTSAQIRAAGWAEALVLLAGAGAGAGPVVAPNGARAEAELVDGTIRVTVRCGRVLDEIMLRSYCIGAAHMAWSWVTSEALTVDAEGHIHDLTIRSFGVTRAVDTPPIEITIDSTDNSEPVNGSDSVFVAVAAASWLSLGCRQDWPVGTTMG